GRELFVRACTVYLKIAEHSRTVARPRSNIQSRRSLQWPGPLIKNKSKIKIKRQTRSRAVAERILALNRRLSAKRRACRGRSRLGYEYEVVRRRRRHGDRSRCRPGQDAARKADRDAGRRRMRQIGKSYQAADGSYVGGSLQRPSSGIACSRHYSRTVS